MAGKEELKLTIEALLQRNMVATSEQFGLDPSKIFVAIQLEEDQVDHLSSGLMKRSRRLVPLTYLAGLIANLLDRHK